VAHFEPFGIIIDKIGFNKLGKIKIMLSEEDVEKIAHLARLGVEKESMAQYAKDLNNVLDLVAQMAPLETEDVQPMAHPMDQVQRLREDIVTEYDQRDYFQKIAPQTESGLYLVPKVIE
jgi:aspartyl-tRNA(Asn)/glutamyl-tRNA(Gln) amidotransferase subunit C